MLTAPEEVLDFWFKALTPDQWFKPDVLLDAEIAKRFGVTYEALERHVPERWLGTARGALAAVIVLDQFPRNMFRGTRRAFATDVAALAIAEAAITQHFDDRLTVSERQFLYLPLQHAEDRGAQARSVALYEKLGEAQGSDYARRHRDIIERFGRFPHRNAILGRASTPQEIEFLREPGSSF